MQNLESEIKILNVKRLNKRNGDPD